MDPREWVQGTVSQAILAMAIVKAGQKISPLEELRLALTKESTESTIQSLAKSLVATGLPGCDAQNITTASKRLEEQFGADTLQLLCIRNLADQLRRGETTVHAIPAYLADDVVALAVEIEADIQIRQIFPDQLVDTFEGKLPYIPVIDMGEKHLSDVGTPGRISFSRCQASVVRWVDAYDHPGLAFHHNVGISQMPMDVINQRYSNDKSEWYGEDKLWMTRSRIEEYQKLRECFYFQEDRPETNLVCKRVNALVHGRPLGKEVPINQEFFAPCVQGPGMTDGKPTVHLLDTPEQ